MNTRSARHIGKSKTPDFKSTGLHPVDLALKKPKIRAMKIHASNAGPLKLLQTALSEAMDSDTPKSVLGWVRNRLSLGAEFPWNPIRFSAKNKTSGNVRHLKPSGQGPSTGPRKDERIIGTLLSPDALLLRAIEALLLDSLDPSFSKNSYAYRGNGQTQKHALERFHSLIWGTRAFSHTAKVDIRDFFGTIPHQEVLNRLQDFGIPQELIALIEGFLRFASSTSPLSRPGLGLLQGSPISGILANVYLDSLDRHLEALGVPFIRYADDITLLANSVEALEAAIRDTATKLNSLGLALNESKTIRFNTTLKDQTFDLLGFEFKSDGSYQIRAKSLNKAKLKICKHLANSRLTGASHLQENAVKKAIHLLNLFFGYEPRPSKPRSPDDLSSKLARTHRYRLCKPSRNGRFGWIRYWTHLPYSPLIDKQLQNITREIRTALRPKQRSLRLSLRSPATAYRTLTHKHTQGARA